MRRVRLSHATQQIMGPLPLLFLLSGNEVATTVPGRLVMADSGRMMYASACLVANEGRQQNSSRPGLWYSCNFPPHRNLNRYFFANTTAAIRDLISPFHHHLKPSMLHLIARSVVKPHPIIKTPPRSTLMAGCANHSQHPRTLTFSLDGPYPSLWALGPSQLANSPHISGSTHA